MTRSMGKITLVRRVVQVCMLGLFCLPPLLAGWGLAGLFAGGDGEVTICRLLGEKELNGKCGLYAQVTIQPGSSLGYHVHHNESETYYILSGEAEYNDNGTPRMVKAGDVTYPPAGCGHGLRPVGDQPVVFMALIIYD